MAYLDKDNQQDWLKSGLNASSDFVFPYRDETFAMLDQLDEITDHWKLKYYKALIYWEKGCLDKAGELFIQCDSEPDYAPFYMAKADLFRDNLEIMKSGLQKAKMLDKYNWWVNLALIEQYLSDEEFTLSADLAEKSFNENPERSVLGLNYAIALLNLAEYRKCISFLESFELIPFEGAVMGRNVYHDASIMAAIDEMKKEKYKNAITDAEKASLWPNNFGSGRPYDPDERIENFILAFCNEKLGRNEVANNLYAKVRDFEKLEGARENAFLYLQILSLEKINGEEAAQKRLEEAINEDSENKSVIWISKIKSDGISLSETREMVLAEKQSSPINNEFLLLNDLLEIVDY